MTITLPDDWAAVVSQYEPSGEGAFMRAYSRHKDNEPTPKGPTCGMCGFPCERDQVIFIVPREFCQERYVRKDATPTAHVTCALVMYRGRYEMLNRLLREGASVEEMKQKLATWPN